MIRLFVATPCYGGTLCVNYAASVLRLQSACRQIGMPVEFDFHSGESLITRARNECVAHFMQSAATHLLFVDSDIGFSPGAVLRLAESGFDVVAGAYPLKCDELRFPVDYEALGPADRNGFAKASMLTTGFMCIARGVFDRIREARPDLRYQTDEGHERYAYFDAVLEGGAYLSEDYGFCRLWQSLGGSVYLDTLAELTHQGKKLYSGCIAKVLEDDGRAEA